MSIESITGSLKELCRTIQELVRVPSDVVLHRSKCCILAKSYALGLQAVIEVVEEFCPLRSRADYCQTLIPTLSELFLAMEQGKRFIGKCLQGFDWVERTVVLALSTEAVDVCLQDLIWCICVIYQAVEQVLTFSEDRFLADLERKHDIYSRLNTLWADASDEQDLAILLDALNQKVAEDESLDVCGYRLAKFMLQKLSSGKYLEHGSADERLPGCLWVHFNEFQIMGSIGGGAFAAVFKVLWCGETFGLKEFLPVNNKDSFSRESALQARLRHPNLVQLICCTENSLLDRYGLVMELMDVDLHSLINQQIKDGRETPFSLVTAVDIMLQIAKGMEYLHSHGIMHRDLKSFNVLVSKLNPFDCLDNLGNCRLRAKVADFGMAKAKYPGAQFTTLQIGTTFWRAPEVFEMTLEDDLEDQSNAKYTMKADVYSFAMVCYEILTGKIPFDDGGRRMELHQRLLRGVRPQLPSSCPAYLASYIKRCWHGDPSKRPSFTQICRTMRQLKGSLLTSADPLSSFALSRQSCSLIKEEIDSEIGPNLVCLSREVTLRSMAVLYDKPLYKTLMERQTLHQEEESNVQVLDETMPVCVVPVEVMPVCAVPDEIMPRRPESRGSGLGWVRSIKKHLRRKPEDRLLENLKEHLGCGLRSFALKELSAATNKFSGSVGYGLRSFTSKELSTATNKFAESIDQGRSIFRGTLADGQEVAVTVISYFQHRGYFIQLAANEVRILGAVRHANIVRLLGWCIGKGSLMLVYEHMTRGGLAMNLFEQGHPNLSWPQRYKIVSGVASALNYLHYACKPWVLHRNPTPSSVMLDEECNARLGKFGFAVPMHESHVELNSLEGTSGYLAPEIFSTRIVSPATDVYAFGVLALAVACGRRVVDDGRHVGKLVWELYAAGRLLDAGDKTLMLAGDLEEKQMACVLQLGLACIQIDPSNRPSMAFVDLVLSGEIPPSIPAHAPFPWPSSMWDDDEH